MKNKWDEYIGKQTNYGQVKSIWPQGGDGFIIVNVEDGSQFLILGSTLHIVYENPPALRQMIVRSDFTGVTVGYYDESPTSKGGLNYFRKVCTFEGGKEQAEKHATQFIKSYNEYDHLKSENERLKINKDISMSLALEFGYKQCEKGENIQSAILNYKKLTQ